MRFRLYSILATLLILIFTAFAFVSWSSTREPTYDNRPLSHWLSQVQMPFTKTNISSSTARVALGAMGGDSARFLWHEMQVTDSPLKLQLLKLARKQSFVPINHTPANLRRVRAHAMFPAVGEWAATEIPMLIDALEAPDADVKSRAQNCLQWILYKADPNATSAQLIRCLKNRNPDRRKHAALACRRVPPPAATNTLPGLQFLVLNDKSPDVRASASTALGGIRPIQRSVIETLLNAIRDPHALVRRSAILALAEIGPEAEPARSELTRLLNKPDPEFLPELREALAKIAPQGMTIDQTLPR